MTKELDRQKALQAAFSRSHKDIMIMWNILREERDADVIPVYIPNKDMTIIFCKGNMTKGILKIFDPGDES